MLKYKGNTLNFSHNIIDPTTCFNLEQCDGIGFRIDNGMMLNISKFQNLKRFRVLPGGQNFNGISKADLVSDFYDIGLRCINPDNFSDETVDFPFMPVVVVLKSFVGFTKIEPCTIFPVKDPVEFGKPFRVQFCRLRECYYSGNCILIGFDDGCKIVDSL